MKRAEARRKGVRGDGGSEQDDRGPKADQPAESVSILRPSLSPPVGLTRSLVYRRMPMGERLRLDAAIVARPGKQGSLERIHAEFDLFKQHGVSPAALRSYARMLEDWLRPVAMSQVMAGLLGCLPKVYRRRLVAGTEVLLLSRVMQALDDPRPDAEPLGIADLAKLASILMSLGKRAGGGGRPSQTCTSLQVRKQSGKDESTPGNWAELAESVRMLYGITWPPEAKCAGSGEPAWTGAEPDGNGSQETVGLKEG